MSSKVVALIICLAAAASAEQTRPCEGNDFACIQEYLVAATGKSAASSVQDVLSNPEPLQSVLPAFGITMESVDSYAGLAAATFTDLFVEGSYTVLVLNIPTLTRTATATALFYAKGIAPVENHAAGDFIYNDVTLTIVFPSADKVSVDDFVVEVTIDGEVKSDFSTLDAGAAKSDVIKAAQEAILAHLPIYYEEVTAAPGARIARDYLLTNVLA